MSIFQTADLRAEAKDQQRARNHNSKWARGFAPATGKTCPHTSSSTCSDCAAKPFKGFSYTYTKYVQRQHKAQSSKKSASVRSEASWNHDTAFCAKDCWCGEYSYLSDSDSEADEILFSFDAAGPVRNSQILSSAITQAVQRFENKETEKIVKEYDLVADGKDELEFADVEDDFELVDSAHFK